MSWNPNKFSNEKLWNSIVNVPGIDHSVERTIKKRNDLGAHAYQNTWNQPLNKSIKQEILWDL